jgi:hypothetical protein
VNPGAQELPGNGVNEDCNAGTPDGADGNTVTCTVVADRIHYGANEQIGVEVDVRHAMGSATLTGLQVLLDARAVSGAALDHAEQRLTPLLPGELRELRFSPPTGTTVPQVLSLNAQVVSAASVWATCTATTEIVSSLELRNALGGTVESDPDDIFLHESTTLRFSVTNVGNVRLQPAEFEVVLLDPSGSQIVATFPGSATLAVGESTAGEHTVNDLPLGEYLVALRALYGSERVTLAVTGIQVLEPPNEPPDCSGAAFSQTRLWPPNHTFETISVSGITDPDGDPITVAVTDVSQDEAVGAPGSGNTCPDALIESGGVRVRSEREGDGDGRVYRIRVRGTDPSGESCSQELTLCVPHSNSSSGCVESLQTHDSTSCN